MSNKKPHNTEGKHVVGKNGSMPPALQISAGSLNSRY